MATTRGPRANKPIDACSAGCSGEIALAIWELTADADTADRIWQDPTPAEFDAVTTRAWELADADETELHWGEETIRRAA